MEYEWSIFRWIDRIYMTFKYPSGVAPEGINTNPQFFRHGDNGYQNDHTNRTNLGTSLLTGHTL